MKLTTIKVGVILACAFSLTLAGELRAQTRYEAVHTFSGNRGRPLGALTEGSDGRLYGTTVAGGFFGKGSVYATDGAGTLETIHEFSGLDGQAPRGQLLLASDGALYGTTSLGGDGGGDGLGTIFRIAPDGTFATVARFDDGNGRTPQAGLLQASDGNFYGTASAGGAGGFGTIFRLAPSGELTALVSLSSENTFPTGRLIQAADGLLYGSTTDGGESGFGTIFSVTLNGTLTTIYSFPGGVGGAVPTDGPIQASDGSFYGTTLNGGNAGCLGEGCGTVYRLTLGATPLVSTLTVFSGANGELPSGALRQLSDGLIYGTTQEGGSVDAGTVFQLSPDDGAFSTVASFDFQNGSSPSSGVSQATSGAIYGTTVAGGLATYGTVFELMPDGAIRSAVSFSGAIGADPAASLMQASDGHFYGTTRTGGEHGNGSVFRMTAGGDVTTLASFTFDTGIGPSGALLQASDGYLYGVAEGGGATGDGTVFRVTLGGELTAVASFQFFTSEESIGTGAAPWGRLIEASDGRLYGTALFGADGAPGAVFGVDRTAGTIEAFAFAVDESHGLFPSSGVTQAPDGSFYGTAEMGGANAFGTVFRMSAAGDLSTVIAFSDTDGSFPVSPLALGSDGNLYGTTSSGGDGLEGTLFQLALDGTDTLTTLASFDITNGSFPYQQGVVEAGGFLYGSTMFGGDAGFGTVYRWSVGTGIEVLHSVDGVTGDGPNSTLIKAVDGSLYGTAIGPQGGVIYRMVADDVQVEAALAVAPAAATYGGSATLSATLTAGGAPLAGAGIMFSLNESAVGSATTGPDGVATLADVSVAGVDAGSYPGAILASFAGADGILGTTATGNLTIARATATIAIEDATYVYDGQPHPATGTVSGIGGEALGPLTFTYNGDTAAPVEPGSYAVVASYAGSTNYEPASAPALITIVPAPPGVGGLIAAYGFEEGSGAIAGDASGNGHGGTVKQAQWSASGRFGRALDFDGVNDWVTIADDAELDLQTAITLEAWVNPRALSGWNTILMKEGDERLAYALYANDSYPRPAGYVRVAGVDQSAVGRNGLPTNTWSHIAMTYSGSLLRLYVNGTEVHQRVLLGKILSTGGALRIGGNSIWGEYFNGLVDEVRIYGRELTAAEIARDMNTPVAREAVPPSVAIVSPIAGGTLSGVPLVTVSASDNFAISSVQLQVDGVDAGPARSGAPFTFSLDAANGTRVLTAVARDVSGNSMVSDPVTIIIANAPVADYAFNEGNGSMVLDASGRNNNGAISGGVTRVTDATRGQVLSFNGFDGLISVADAASLDLTNAMTLEAWVRPTSADGWRTVMLKEGDGLSYGLYANDADASKPAGYVRINNVDQAIRARRKLTVGAWTHLAMTYDGTTMRMFVNGVEVESRRQTGSAEVSAGKLRIGGNRVWGEYFRGQMDDVRIYDVAVSSAQIKADMNR